MSDIESIIKSNDIVVFSADYCPYCADAIKALNGTGKKFKIVEATNDQRRDLEKKTGSSSVPNIWVKGKYVGGCNDGPESWMGIKKIIANKKLEELLK